MRGWPSWGRNALLLLPALVLLVGVFAVPMFVLVRMSLNGSAGTPYATALTFDSYARALTEPVYLRILWRTIRLALAATLLSVLLGWPYAYVTWRSSGWRKAALLFVALLPLFTNVISRLYGWQIILSPRGPMNQILLATGFISEPVRLNYSFWGALIGLTYVALPYFVLIFYSSLLTVDWHLVSAARSLGASRLSSLKEVVVPLTAPGLAAGIAVTFAWGMGAYAETVTLGSPQEWGLGFEATRQWTQVRDWPFSSVLSVLMVATTFLVMVLVTKLAVRGPSRAAAAPAAEMKP